MSERVNRFISNLYRYNQRYFAARLRPYDLDLGVTPTFTQSCRFPGITQEGIAARSGLDKGTIARSVRQLEDQGYITRRVDPDDRRVNHIYPTPKALELYPKISAVIDDLHAILYQGFTDEEVDRTIEALSRMRDNIKEHLAGGNAGEPKL